MYLERGNIKLSGNPRDNLRELKGIFYQLDFLNGDGRYIHGGNGIVFKLTDEQENLEYVIKIFKFSYEEAEKDWKIEKKLLRFEREVEALYVAKENTLLGIVQIEFDGAVDIEGEIFPYYVMQKCDCTLKHYMTAEGDNLDAVQKTILCQKILEGVQQLHEFKIYHRDIKHENIFFLNGEPLIGDLGLVDYQNSDYNINERGELIGPTGWFSPEAINKYLVENTPNLNGFDCTIDEKSEVFQMGKLFWYIYQGNIPVGQIVAEDFLPSNNAIFSILFGMLSYSKTHRLATAQVAEKINNFLSVN